MCFQSLKLVGDGMELLLIKMILKLRHELTRGHHGS